jgi:hypothetical protein
MERNLHMSSQHNLHMFSMTWWCIWKQGNNKLWHNVENRLDVSVTLAWDSLLQWQHARPREQRDVAISNTIKHFVAMQSSVNVIRWRKPNMGEVKCNIDTTIFKEQWCYDVIICLRGDHIEFISAKTTWFHGLP